VAPRQTQTISARESRDTVGAATRSHDKTRAPLRRIFLRHQKLFSVSNGEHLATNEDRKRVLETERRLYFYVESGGVFTFDLIVDSARIAYGSVVQKISVNEVPEYSG